MRGRSKFTKQLLWSRVAPPGEFLRVRQWHLILWLTGETIVGDGTTAQLCAMLTGVDERKQPEARRRISSSKPVDSWRWIFKNYKEKGYATMFSEDSPYLASFNYRLHGFQDPPTDHYARPFWIETDKLIKAHCVNNRPSHEFLSQI